MDSFDQAWDIICEFCQSRITDVAYKTWFSRLRPVSIDFEKGVAIIEAPNDFHKQTLLRCYSDLLSQALQNVFGGNIGFELCVTEEPDRISEKDANQDDGYDLTFNTFVVGPSNRFAHAACQAVASKPALLYNPLFIYGNSGLGKTHLLSAVSSEFRANFPDRTVVYVKSEDFTNEVIDAIARGTTSALRAKYRNADLLLMDDVQFIGGKTSTQEEFFHTFNELYQSSKQIILTSDRPPKEIKTLEDRLRTRFEWGLLADIQPPDYETRIAIIHRKAELIHIHIPDDVAEYIANKLKNNIRQLEGVVNRLKAFQQLIGSPPSILTAQSAIKDILNEHQPIPMTVERIVTEVARTYSVTGEDIRSGKRSSTISTARQVAMYIVREITQMSMSTIGEEFGNRDHSTVVYATKQVEKRMERDSHYRETVEDIIKNIKATS